MRGYLRQDGRKGIRNTIVVGYLVECAHHVAREIALPFREHDVHVIGFPGCYPNSYAERMMERLCSHPKPRPHNHSQQPGWNHNDRGSFSAR